MEINKLVVMITGGVVGLLLLAYLLIPVVSDSQTSIDTESYSNEGYTLRYAESDSIQLYHANLLTNEIEYNGTILALNAAGPYFISDGFVLYSISDGSAYKLAIWSEETSNISSLEWTFSAANGTWTYSVSGASPITGSYSKIYCVDPNGAYGLFDTASTTIHLNTDATAIGFYNSSVGGWHMPPTEFSSESESPATTPFYGTDNTVHENGGVTFTIADDAPWYTLSNMVFSPNASTHLSMQVVAPITYTETESNAHSTMLGIIPLMVIVVLVVFMANWIRVRN